MYDRMKWNTNHHKQDARRHRHTDSSKNVDKDSQSIIIVTLEKVINNKKYRPGKSEHHGENDHDDAMTYCIENVHLKMNTALPEIGSSGKGRRRRLVNNDIIAGRKIERQKQEFSFSYTECVILCCV